MIPSFLQPFQFHHIQLSRLDFLPLQDQGCSLTFALLPLEPILYMSIHFLLVHECLLPLNYYFPSIISPSLCISLKLNRLHETLSRSEERRIGISKANYRTE